MGYMITQIPGGWIAGYVGGTRTFGAGLLLTSFFTLFTAVAAKLDYFALIAIRIMEGIAEVLQIKLLVCNYGKSDCL